MNVRLNKRTNKSVLEQALSYAERTYGTPSYTQEQRDEAVRYFNRWMKSTKKRLDEGFFKGLLGASLGAIFGKDIGKKICSILNISSGKTYDLLTSRAFYSALAGALGLNA